MKSAVIISTIFFLVLFSCFENTERKKVSNLRESDTIQSVGIEIPGYCYSKTDTLFFEEKFCYFRAGKMKQKYVVERFPGIKGDVLLPYFINHDTLRILALLSKTGDGKSDMKIDTTNFYFKIYGDSLVLLKNTPNYIFRTRVYVFFKTLE